MQDKELVFNGNFVRGDERQVKGFLSFNTEDNDFQAFPPESFDLKSFLQKGTLLYNHKLWLDEQNNPIPIGSCQSIEIVKILNIPDNSDFWAVKSIEKDKVIDIFPKERISGAEAGDRGLWVIANVEVPEVWHRVLRKKLNGFSWKGAARMKLLDIKGKIQKEVSTLVKMLEVSLVFTPQHPNAMLVPVVKSALSDTIEREGIKFKKDEGSHGLFGFVFSSGLFNKKSSESWLETKGFDHQDEDFIELSDGELVYLQTGQEAFTSDLKTIGVEQGVQAIIGVLDASTLDIPERDEIFRLTQKLLGGKVQSLEEIKEKSMKDAVKNDEVVSEEKASQEESNDKLDATIVNVPEAKESLDGSEDKNAADNDVAERSESEVSDSPIAESAIEPVLEGSEGSDGVQGSDPQLSVETTSDENQEAKLSNIMEDKLSAITNTIVECLSQKLDSIISTVNDHVSKLGEATAKLADIAVAQSKAVMDLTEEGVEAEMAKTAVTEEEKPDLVAEVNTLKEQIETLMKSPVGKVVPTEEMKSEKNSHPNDVIGGPAWPFK